MKLIKKETIDNLIGAGGCFAVVSAMAFVATFVCIVMAYLLDKLLLFIGILN